MRLDAKLKVVSIAMLVLPLYESLNLSVGLDWVYEIVDIQTELNRWMRGLLDKYSNLNLLKTVGDIFKESEFRKETIIETGWFYFN